MASYVVHDVDGEITRCGECPDADLIHQGEPEFLIEVDGLYSMFVAHVVNGAVVLYTPEQAARKSSRPPYLARWSNDSCSWIDMRTSAQLVDAAIADGEVAAQAYLDAAAQAWGYDDLRSAASYVTSKVPKFAAEAAALVGWRDDVWLAAYELGVQVRAGAVPIPASTEAFVALLPAVPARPTP